MGFLPLAFKVWCFSCTCSAVLH